MPLDPVVVAVVVGILIAVLAGVLVALIVVWRRVRARRLDEREAAELERAIRVRLAWIGGDWTPTGLTDMPPPDSVPVTVHDDVRWVVSPRRRLGRDTAAVLLVGIGTILVASLLPGGSTDSQGPPPAGTPARASQSPSASRSSSASPSLAPSPSPELRPTVRPSRKPTPARSPVTMASP